MESTKGERREFEVRSPKCSLSFFFFLFNSPPSSSPFVCVGTCLARGAMQFELIFEKGGERRGKAYITDDGAR